MEVSPNEARRIHELRFGEGLGSCISAGDVRGRRQKGDSDCLVAEVVLVLVGVAVCWTRISASGLAGGACASVGGTVGGETAIVECDENEC